MNPNVVIRPMQPEDVTSVYNIGSSVDFWISEQLLALALSIKQEGKIRNAFLVAEFEERVIGFFIVTNCMKEPTSPGMFGLGLTLFVVPEFHQQGIAEELVRTALDKFDYEAALAPRYTIVTGEELEYETALRNLGFDQGQALRVYGSNMDGVDDR